MQHDRRDACDKSSHHSPSDALRLKTRAFSSSVMLHATAASILVTSVQKTHDVMVCPHISETTAFEEVGYHSILPPSVVTKSVLWLGSPDVQKWAALADFSTASKNCRW